LRILIAGKQAALRSALKILVQTRPGFEIVATAANKEELFRMYEASRPDLLLLDEDLNEAFMDTVVLPLQEFDPKSLIMILGKRPESKEAYLEAGAVAYLTKDDSPKSLLTALEEARLQRKHG
jgi:DNA-binding NarL/FixJ family response regulator